MMKKRLLPEVFEQLVYYAYEAIPNYPASVDAALTLCDRLREEGALIWFYTGMIPMWEVTVVIENREIVTCDPSLARAICLAFLKVGRG